MFLTERWRRLRTWQKLSNGRCRSCGKVLRDDETSGYCSEQCWADSVI